MKMIKLLLLQLAFSTVCYGQAYVINHFQSSYDTITNYNSVNIELGLAGEDPYYWEKNFDFGFEFPFFGDTYSNVYMDKDAVGYFPGSEEFNLELFSGSYMIGLILDTPYLYSEVRYISTMANNLEALVIEYHNVYVLDEGIDDHYINFQTWFYENGVIELHFGDIDLTNCSYYFPGQGFSFDNQDPIGNIYGPWVAISNFDLGESACFFGDHSDPDILYDDDGNCGVVTSIPPEGFVVQFAPSDISAIDEYKKETENKYQLIEQDGVVQIMGDLSEYKSCSVYDFMGRRIAYSESNEVLVGLNSSQVYIVVIESESGIETHKLFVK